MVKKSLRDDITSGVRRKGSSIQIKLEHVTSPTDNVETKGRQGFQISTDSHNITELCIEGSGTRSECIEGGSSQIELSGGDASVLDGGSSVQTVNSYGISGRLGIVDTNIDLDVGNSWEFPGQGNIGELCGPRQLRPRSGKANEPSSFDFLQSTALSSDDPPDEGIDLPSRGGECGLHCSQDGTSIEKVSEKLVDCTGDHDGGFPVFKNDDGSVVVDGVYYRTPCGIKCEGSHHLAGCRLQLNPCAFFEECFMLYDKADVGCDYIFDGVCNGFKILDDEFSGSYHCSNYDSIMDIEFKQQMDQIVKEELSVDKVTLVDYVPTCVHSLGAVRKSNDKLRPITDCKRPLGYSINNHMDTVCDDFHFIHVDDITDSMVPGCYFAVVDIKSAYRSINVYPSHRSFQGFEWELDGNEEYYEDNCLCFGLKCAPYIFSRVSNFVVRCMRRRGYANVYGYLDDFLVMEETEERCQEALAQLLSLLRKLGFFVAWNKVFTPCQTVVYLGIELDSVAMEIRLPDRKVRKVSALVEEFATKETCSKKELQILAGNLAHASMVVRGGRTFSRRIINMVKYLPDGAMKCKIPDWMKEDLHWWHRFIEVFNGSARIIAPLSYTCIPLETDSSFSGFGCKWGNDWCAGVWDMPVHILSEFIPLEHCAEGPNAGANGLDINVLELWPVLQAVKKWGSSWSNTKVKVITDNTQVRQMINTGRSSSVMCMQWLRELFWVTVVYNIHLVASYIKSENNVLPDFLSRLFDSRRTGTPPVELLNSLCCFRVPGIEAADAGLPIMLDGRFHRIN